jgi:sugar phosphate isomerase/epimerase
MGRAEFLQRCAAQGIRKVEAFTGWAGASVDFTGDAQAQREEAAAHGITYTSLHLPPVTDASGPSFERAVTAARFAAALGVKVVLYKADSRPTYIRAGKPFLDAIDGLGLTPVVQNHAGSPITTLADMLEVLNGVNDPRLRALLEVGYFHHVGQPWLEAAEALGDRIALVHVKDQIGTERVPFGTGEIDFRALFTWLRRAHYHGEIVIECEIARDDFDATFGHQAEAIGLFTRIFHELDAQEPNHG